MQKQKTVILSVTNDLVSDQRVHKVASTLLNNNFKVILVGRKLRNSKNITKRTYKTFRFNLVFNKGFLFYAEYNTKLFFYLLFKNFDILNSNDLDSLPANYLLSVIKRKKIVYDSHEFFTEVPELVNRPKVKNFWLSIEKHILPKIKYSYTVSPEIANEYKKLYDINMGLIFNFPFKLDVTNHIKNEKIIIYQGALNIGRGLETIILAMKNIENAKLQIIGSGDIETQLKQLTIKNNLSNKIEFIGQISFENLYKYTINASIGISLEENIGFNYKYALPNKLFDYINAEIPVLVSNLPEMAKIVKEYEVGEIVTDYSEKGISKQLNNILNNNELLLKYSTNTKNAKNVLNWKNQENTLLKFYK